MATLLIILLGTMLIQGSSLTRAMRHDDRDALRHSAQDEASANHADMNTPTARGDRRLLLRRGLWTVIALTLCSLWGYVAQRWLMTSFNWPDLHILILLSGIVLLLVAAHRLPQRWLPAAPLTLLSTHAALLGLALFSARYAESALDALGYGLGSGLTLWLLSACFDALRERLDDSDMPLTFRGIPIALITTGFMALAFMGFAGLVRN